MVKTVRSKWVKLVILKVAQVKKSVGTPDLNYYELLPYSPFAKTKHSQRHKINRNNEIKNKDELCIGLWG